MKTTDFEKAFNEITTNEDFDAEREIYLILAKLQKNGVFEELDKFQADIIKYLNKEWGEESPNQEQMVDVVMSHLDNKHLKKITEVLDDKEVLILITAISGTLFELEHLAQTQEN